jgi:hypothetical protein
MTRVVVRVAAAPNEDQTDEDIFFSLEDPPYAIPDFEKLRPFTCKRSSILDRFYEDPPSGDNMREVGEMLLIRLGQHPAVADAVRYALQQTPPNGCCPLYMRLIGSETAGEYPWETLFDPGSGFLALEGRWPIARIAAQVPREKDLRMFTPPLKVMAVMSAIGVSAADEWVALRDAVAASGIAMEVELNLWVGERDLAERIGGDLVAGGLRGSVTMLSEGHKLLTDIKRFDPHILHLFCHGTGGPAPLLQLATRRDHTLHRGSSVVLEPLQLRGLGRSTWMVTLNCCEGGSDSDGARSIAYLLIHAGYPAIVGMREPVSSANAALFARSFYTSLLEQLDKSLVLGQEVEIELAASLVTPRRELRDQFQHPTPAEAAARHRDWTLPVLYVRPDPLRIKHVPADPKHSDSTRRSTTEYLDTLMKFRLEAPPDVPDDVLKRIDAEIRRALKALAGDGE